MPRFAEILVRNPVFPVPGNRFNPAQRNHPDAIVRKLQRKIAQFTAPVKEPTHCAPLVVLDPVKAEVSLVAHLAVDQSMKLAADRNDICRLPGLVLLQNVTPKPVLCQNVAQFLFKLPAGRPVVYLRCRSSHLRDICSNN